MAADTVARLQAALEETEAVLAVPFTQINSGWRGVPDRSHGNYSTTSLGVRGYKTKAGLVVESTVLEQVLSLWNSLGFRTKVTRIGEITEVIGELPDGSIIELGVTDSTIAIHAVTQLIETE